MFDRFTERARKVMGFARREAQRFHHEYIGTEHILLGLIQEGQGVAANVLKSMAIDLEKIRREVEKIVKSGPAMEPSVQIPFTPRAKKVVELALEEAGNLGHNYIGTEHLLLALLREQEGIAAHVLMALGVRLDEVREEVIEFLGGPVQEEEETDEVSRAKTRQLRTASRRLRPSMPSAVTSPKPPSAANSTRSLAARTRSNA